MTVVPRPFVYFKDAAKRLGMPNVKDAGDMAIWLYIIKHQAVVAK